jgi:hypothetical protein
VPVALLVAARLPRSSVDAVKHITRLPSRHVVHLHYNAYGELRRTLPKSLPDDS